jgi:hypothetical protein
MAIRFGSGFRLLLGLFRRRGHGDLINTYVNGSINPFGIPIDALNRAGILGACSDAGKCQGDGK